MLLAAVAIAIPGQGLVVLAAVVATTQGRLVVLAALVVALLKNVQLFFPTVRSAHGIVDIVMLVVSLHNQWNYLILANLEINPLRHLQRLVLDPPWTGRYYYFNLCHNLLINLKVSGDQPDQ